MKITLLTVGSRGDIQPYLALGIGLRAAGHCVRFATEEIYRDLITQHRLEFAKLPGDSKARHADDRWIDHLESTQNNLTRSIRDCTVKFIVPTLRSQLEATWIACQDADAILSSPSVFGSWHVAYKLGIPFYIAWTSPAHPTRAFPHSWSRLPDQRWLNGWVNLRSARSVEHPFWQVAAPIINQWRQDQLDLPAFGSNPDEMQQFQHSPTLNAYSSSMLPKHQDR